MPWGEEFLETILAVAWRDARRDRPDHPGPRRMRKPITLRTLVLTLALLAACAGEDEGTGHPSSEDREPPPPSAAEVTPAPTPNAIESADATEPDAAAEPVEPLDDLFDREFLDEAEAVRTADLALRHPDPAVRAQAVRALGEQEGRLASDTLVAALRDPATEVVVAALQSLEWRDDARAVSEIERLLFASDPEVVQAARDALDTLDTPE